MQHFPTHCEKSRGGESTSAACSNEKFRSSISEEVNFLNFVTAIHAKLPVTEIINLTGIVIRKKTLFTILSSLFKSVLINDIKQKLNKNESLLNNSPPQKKFLLL
jgi:hypothetical protein